MKKIANFTNDDGQYQKVVLVDGTEFDLTILFKPQQRGWFASITYKTKTINNIRICTSGNFLYQWRNILPFGIACITEADQEPMFQDDLISGRVSLYVLSSDEVTTYSGVISGQISA